MRILVVEDYPPVRTAVVSALRESGYAVDEVATGDAGLARGLERDYDVIVLDLMLPGLDGLSLLRALRERERTSHVLILTARDTLEEKTAGLDLGADDYLVKPFEMEELLARVRALLRREYAQKQPVLRIGHLEINTNTHGVKVGGAPVELTAREYVLLEYLALRTGQVVSRAEIWEHIYDDKANTSSNVVDVYIGYLRKKLERPHGPRLLHTRRGEGYLLGPVE